MNRFSEKLKRLKLKLPDDLPEKVKGKHIFLLFMALITAQDLFFLVNTNLYQEHGNVAVMLAATSFLLGVGWTIVLFVFLADKE